MTYTGQAKIADHTAPKPAALWVHDVLEPDQISTAEPSFGRRNLNRGTVFILWALRVYVILMVVLIGIQVWNALHAGA